MTKIENYEQWNTRQVNRRKEIIELQELDEITAIRLLNDWENHDRVVYELCSSYPQLSAILPRVLQIGFEVARSRLFMSGNIVPENVPQVYGWALTLWKAIWKGTRLRLGEVVDWRNKALEIWNQNATISH